jgi:predicted Zn-ribbon and HTH transcriptional regulator
MGDVVKLTRGRRLPGKALPKPIECRECGDDVETARVQALTGDNIMQPVRCFSCQSAWERRFAREMEAIRDYQTIQIIR